MNTERPLISFDWAIKVEEILKYQDMDEQGKIDYDAHLKSLAISSNVM